MADPLILAHEIMKKLEQKRLDQGMQQKDLGAAVKRSQSMISTWMARNSVPTLRNACALAQALGLKIVLVDDPERGNE